MGAIGRGEFARRAAVAAVAVLLLALTGCGGDGEPEPSDDASATQPEEQQDAEPSQGAADDAVSDPVEGAEGEGQTTVSVYFPLEGEGDPCEDVSEVTREVSAEDPISESLYALLAGPTEAEREEGYGGWFSEDTAGMINGYRSDGGGLLVDFQDFSETIPNASSSCGSSALLAQLDTTLGQFPDIGEPRYSFEGDVDAFYEWLQLESPASG